jgi:hypothetical protein
LHFICIVRINRNGALTILGGDMNRQISLSIFIGVILILTLSCNLFSNLSNQANVVKETAQSVVTMAGEGQKWIETAKAVTTNVGESGLLETAQAYVTEAGNSSFLQTAQAYTTQEAPQLMETAKAIASHIPSNTGELPKDIPLVTGENEELFVSNELVSYMTSQDYNSVVEFYKKEMPNNGWEQDDKDVIETSNISYLYFKKQDRTASIVISINPLNNKTVVLITLQ